MSDTLAKDFRAWLTTQPIIASLCEGRVCEAFMDELQENAKPYIVFRMSGETNEVDLSGDGGLANATFDIEVRADGQGEADVIATEVKRLVNGFPQAALTDKTWNGRSVSFAAINDHSKDYEVLPVGSFETDSIHALIVEVYADG